MTPTPEPAGPAGPAPVDRSAGVTRLRSVLLPRLRRVDLLVALLLGVLGFAAAVQVRSTQVDGVLATARPEDLVQILDDLSGRDERLRQEVAELTAARDRLSSAGSNEAALEQARRRTQVLGVLAGTATATGPGVVLTISDSTGGVRAEVLLDALEELRDAGAEALQLEGAPRDGAPVAVRVTAATYLVDDDAGVRVDGVLLQPPYRFVALGEPATLASALGIPGGVVATVARVGGAASVQRSDALAVTALRALQAPRYARPDPGG